jgi:hypothetical protein
MLNPALSGVGIAYLPEDLAQPYHKDRRLKRVLEDWCHPTPGLTFITRAVDNPRQPSRQCSTRFVTENKCLQDAISARNDRNRAEVSEVANSVHGAPTVVSRIDPTYEVRPQCSILRLCRTRQV